jgi:serine/threonine protein kinase
MVMDLVRGGELFNAVVAEGRLNESSARLYFQQLIDGISYCHRRRLYHRNLKFDNLLLSKDKTTLKISDFGLASIKAHNASSEILHTVIG